MYANVIYHSYAYSINRRMIATEHQHVIIEASDRTMHDRLVLPDCYILDCDMYCDVLCMLRLKKFEWQLLIVAHMLCFSYFLCNDHLHNIASQLMLILLPHLSDKPVNYEVAQVFLAHFIDQ